MQEITIRLYDNSVYLGVLELSEFSDFGLKITKSISDLSDLSKRNTSYSLDFDIPNTPNNNKVLANVKNINKYDNEVKKLQARIYVNENFVDGGVLLPTKSKHNNDFTAVFYGGNKDWVDAIADINIRDLDFDLTQFSGGVETFGSSRIGVVNSGWSGTNDIHYPYMDRNNTGLTEDLRPVIFAYNFFQYAFAKIGYTIDSDFFETEFFKGTELGEYKGLVIDPAFNFTVDEDEIVLTQSAYGTTLIDEDLNAGSWTDGLYLGGSASQEALLWRSRFNTLWNDEISDNSNLFTTASSTYTASSTGVYTVTFNPKDARLYVYIPESSSGAYWSRFFPDTINQNSFFGQVEVILVKNNTSSTVIDGIVLDSIITNVAGDLSTPVDLEASLDAGDELSIWFQFIDSMAGLTGNREYLNSIANGGEGLINWRMQVGESASINIERKSEISLANSDQYTITNHIPKNVKVLDVIQDFKVLFNLYFDPDVNRKIIRIEPRDDYYQNLGSALNITDLIDLNYPIELDYSTDYKSEMVFKYKADSKDKYLERWQNINDRIYGEYIHSFNSTRFEKGQNVLETKLISPTIQGVLQPSNIVTSVIKEEWLQADNDGKGVNKDYNFRLFQLVRNRQFDQAGTPRRTSSPLIVSSALMEGFGGTSTLNDLQLTFNGENGLVANYYAKTLRNIEDFAKVKLRVKMNKNLFSSFDFSRPLYIEQPYDYKGYYVCSSINNYNLNELDSTEIILTRYKDYAPIEIDPTQKTNVNIYNNGDTGNDEGQMYQIIDEGLPTEQIDFLYVYDNNGNLQPLF